MRRPVAASASGLFEENPFDLDHAAKTLQPKVDDLGRALSDVRRERLELQSTRSQLQESFQAFDRAVRGLGWALKGWFFLTGFPELANRTRLTPPTKHAARRREEV